MEHLDGADNTPIRRRTLAKGAAWTAPVVAFAGRAPATAASLRIDPGLNGWVLNSTSSLGLCRFTLRVNSDPGSGSTPDGAPFGMYLYDVQPTAVITNATVTYWIIGDQKATWTANDGHSSCWSAPVRGALQVKSDGLMYRPYTFTYTCPIRPADIGADGRLRLGTFDTTAIFTQPTAQCADLTYWTQRSVTIDQDGAGPQAPTVLTFERRNGTRGPYTPSARTAARATTSGTSAVS